MPRHGLRLVGRYRRAGARYRADRWPLFVPTQYARLTRWFEANGRRPPWREYGVSPWALLLAEMLLRRTSYSHVIRVWPELVRLYPTPADLAQAPPIEVKALVASLGMAEVRTAALKAMAQALLERHGGVVPISYQDLTALPHVGPYTANAVRCFVYGIAGPVVDVNILRIFDRYFGMGTRTRNPHREAHIWRQAKRLMPELEPAAYQYALLDLAALVCRRHNPACAECPIRTGCSYYRRRAALQS